MTTGEKDEFVSYSPLPSNPNPNPNFKSYPYPPNENVVVGLPSYYPIHHRNNRRNYLIPAIVLIFLAAAIFFLYPSDPELHLARIQLNHIAIRANPKPILDLSFSLKLKVRNRDFFSIKYNSLDVSLGYRGREIGTVSSVGGGKIRARGSDYVDVVLSIDGFEVIYDTFYLIHDLAVGVIAFDTVSKIDGKLGFLPLKVFLLLLLFTSQLLLYSIEFDLCLLSEMLDFMIYVHIFLSFGNLIIEFCDYSLEYGLYGYLILLFSANSMLTC